MKVAFNVLLLAAPLALAACGGSSSAQLKVDPVAYVKHAASKTGAVPSYHFAATGETAGDAPVHATFTSSGDVSNAKNELQLSMTLSAPGRSVQLAIIQTAAAAYFQSSMYAGGLLKDTWAKLDSRKLGHSEGTDALSLISRDPAKVLRRLEAAGSVKSLGTERIDGAETTHYQVTNIPHGDPIDVWIGNRNGYVYRASTTMTGMPGSMSMRIDFSNFGEKVNIPIPSVSETIEVSNLDEALGVGA